MRNHGLPKKLDFWGDVAYCQQVPDTTMGFCKSSVSLADLCVSLEEHSLPSKGKLFMESMSPKRKQMELVIARSCSPLIVIYIYKHTAYVYTYVHSLDLNTNVYLVYNLGYSPSPLPGSLLKIEIIVAFCCYILMI